MKTLTAILFYCFVVTMQTRLKLSWVPHWKTHKIVKNSLAFSQKSAHWEPPVYAIFASFHHGPTSKQPIAMSQGVFRVNIILQSSSMLIRTLIEPWVPTCMNHVPLFDDFSNFWVVLKVIYWVFFLFRSFSWF